MLNVETRLARLEARVLKRSSEQDILTENLEYLASESGVVLYDVWQTGREYKKDDKCIYLGNLYSCIQPHTSQDDWTPAVVPALWKREKSGSGEEYPDWAQPYGAHDAYAKDDKVSHNGSHWISTVDGNIWEPGVYGWEVV